VLGNTRYLFVWIGGDENEKEKNKRKEFLAERERENNLFVRCVYDSINPQN
jgi:hypothetical protein